MAELNLKDRLQPALLDRLSDDERLLTLFRIEPIAGALAAQGLTVRDVHRHLLAQGLRPEGATEAAVEQGSAETVLEYIVPGRSVSPASVRATKLQRPAGGEAPLQACCKVEATSIVNSQLESPDRRALSMRKLREAVLRDLGWLLNSFNLEEVVDLGPYPEVRRSVLNYGLPSQAGRVMSAIDVGDVARRIAETLTYFEPRLSAVRVTPERGEGDEREDMALSFRVEADLWGQPMPQHLSLRTSIDFVTGDATVRDEGARS
jgi:type VI secretion system protein ImpF